MDVFIREEYIQRRRMEKRAAAALARKKAGATDAPADTDTIKANANAEREKAPQTSGLLRGDSTGGFFQQAAVSGESVVFGCFSA
ncbi:hypothetical protein SAY87_029441 [Trapa incisa]|uniref:Uncharacterized protein n=1 Tax=Trapa incisa TaxID=236973 RepID=A0AAN7KCW5_9MYRT|nr:hypothetical protein SAY87_029441 [Trapa incisa]